MEAPEGELSRGALWKLTFISAVSVSAIYIPQPLLPLMADDLQVSVGSIGSTATAVQVGYAAGILLLVPLGDRVRAQTLVPLLLAATGLALFVAASISGFQGLTSVLVAAGFTAVVPQIVVPLVSRLLPAQDIGRALGTLSLGLLLGLFGSRLVGSWVAEAWGWRAALASLAALCVAAALATRALLRHALAPSTLSYAQILLSLPRLVATVPELRQSMWMQFFSFSAFSAAWTVIALQLTGPLGWTTATAGLFGLIGLVGGAFTRQVADGADRFGSLRMIAGVLASLSAAAVLLITAADTVLGAAIAMFAVTAGAMSGGVIHQTRVMRATTDRAGANTVFMVTGFLGSAIGARGATAVFARQGISGVGWLDLGLVVAAIVGFLVTVRTERRARVVPR